MELATLPVGRPTKKTPELVAMLAYALGLGMPDQAACELVRITRETLDKWRKEDDEFSDTLKQARAAKMAIRIEGIDVGEAGWQGKAWMLERRHGEHFARPELQVNMNVNAVVEHNVNMIPETDLHRLLGITREVETEVVSLEPEPLIEQPALTDTPPVEDPTNGSEGV